MFSVAWIQNPPSAAGSVSPIATQWKIIMACAALAGLRWIFDCVGSVGALDGSLIKTGLLWLVNTPDAFVGTLPVVTCCDGFLCFYKVNSDRIQISFVSCFICMNWDVWLITFLFQICCLFYFRYISLLFQTCLFLYGTLPFCFRRTSLPLCYRYVACFFSVYYFIVSSMFLFQVCYSHCFSYVSCFVSGILHVCFRCGFCFRYVALPLGRLQKFKETPLAKPPPNELLEKAFKVYHKVLPGHKQILVSTSLFTLPIH